MKGPGQVTVAYCPECRREAIPRWGGEVGVETWPTGAPIWVCAVHGTFTWITTP